MNYLDALKAQVSERLEAEYAGAARAVMKRALLDQLDGLVKFELPPSMVEAKPSKSHISCGMMSTQR